MICDYDLLQGLSSTANPILRFYDWEGDCATYGYFIDPGHYFKSAGVEKYGLHTARRPTGGGIVFHHCDFAFSVLIPAAHPFYGLNTLENYACINNVVIQVVHKWLKSALKPVLLTYEDGQDHAQSKHFCMAKPTKYDVMLEGKKVGGAAQRKTRCGFLHQASIALLLPSEEYLQAVLNVEQGVISAMQRHTYPLLGEDVPSIGKMQNIRRELQNMLTQAFMDSDVTEPRKF